MKSKDGLEIGITLNGWVLALLGVIVFAVVFAFSVRGALGEQPPDVNDVAAAPALDAPQPEPVSAPERPAGLDDSWVYTLNGEWLEPASLGAEVESLPDTGVLTVTGGEGRHVYLSELEYSASIAKTACAAGYHMGSLWELHDISNIVYDYAHPSAYVKSDSGFGPPAGWYGWVRTGYDSSTSATTGTGNCFNWTSTDFAHYGVAVRLSTAWEAAPGDTGPWDATSFTCNMVGPVWCVRD